MYIQKVKKKNQKKMKKKNCKVAIHEKKNILEKRLTNLRKELNLLRSRLILG